jgi:flagellar basal-body rod modification protein FlgD
MVSNISQESNPAISSLNGSSSGSGSKAGKASTSLTADFNSFLTMFTTQLRNQDPTKPVDSDQFASQIAQFTGVEQAVQTNSNLEQLIAMSTQGQINNMVGYIGRYVEANGNQTFLEADYAQFVYDLERQAETVTIKITDADGKLVFEGNGTKAAGRNEVLWDGKDNDGNKVPAGVYSFLVVAKDASQQTIASTTYTTGRVSALELKDGKMQLALNDLKLSPDQVLAVRDLNFYSSPEE